MFLIFVIWCLVGFAGMIVFGSFFEWALHRFVLHKPLRSFRYRFERHAMVHHRVFRADHTYHVQNKTAEAKIPMTWWNGPLMILAACLPFTVIAALTSGWLLLGAFVAACTYYATYEYLHWRMHKPKRRVVERSGIFFLLNGHHLLHHRYMHKNFNVVLPLADLCMNTLIIRSNVCFAQARGESVPDVQPKATGRNAEPEPTLSYAKIQHSRSGESAKCHEQTFAAQGRSHFGDSALTWYGLSRNRDSQPA